MKGDKQKMKKRIERESAYKLYVDINELMTILSVGKNTALKIAENSRAAVKFGKRKLYSIDKIKTYMSSLHEV